MLNRLTWNYRVIADDTRHAPWFAVYTVYYLNGKPIDHSVSQATAFGNDTESVSQAMQLMQTALTKPVLKMSEFPPATDYRRGEWIQVGNATAEWER